MLEYAPLFHQLDDRPLAHCATLCPLDDDTLLAAWFGGAFETSPDVDILAARRAPDDAAWSTPRVIAADDQHSMGQPVFLKRPGDELWLFFDIIEGSPDAPLADWTKAQPYVQRSHDNGQTWDAPTRVLDRPGLMFRSRPLVIGSRILLPVYDETTWQSHIMISDDDGASWRMSEAITTPSGNIHPCLVKLSDGRILAYLRTGGSGGVIWRTESSDGGDTWATPTSTGIPNPNSGIDLLRLASGRLLLAFNDSDHLRTPLCVALAEEDEHWRWQRTLEDDYAEFSYPTLAQTRDGVIHIVYTSRREHIHYARFTENWLLESEVEREFEHQGRHRPDAHAL